MGEDEAMQQNKGCTGKDGADGSIIADGKWQKTLEIIREPNEKKWKFRQIIENDSKHDKQQRVPERNKG